MLDDEDKGLDLDLPRGRYDVPLMVCDRRSTRTASSGTNVVWSGFRRRRILVNGAISPPLRSSGSATRFGSSTPPTPAPYKLQLSNGHEMLADGSDSGLMPAPI